MKCEICVAHGLKSIVNVGISTSTAMWCPPFYDEEGRFHDHDMNTTTTQYSCSNGHEWAEASKPTCWCGWPEDPDGSYKEMRVIGRVCRIEQALYDYADVMDDDHCSLLTKQLLRFEGQRVEIMVKVVEEEMGSPG